MTEPTLWEPARFVDEIEGLELRTRRLVLRRVNEGDRPVLKQHEQDDRIMGRIRDSMDDDKINARLERFLTRWTAAEGEWASLAVTSADGSQYHGNWALRIVNQEHGRIEIGWRLHPDSQGKGIAREASRVMRDYLFDQAGAFRLEAGCTFDNTPSYRLMEAIGMTREGCMRQLYRINGVRYDELIYGMLWDDPRP